MPRRAGLDAEAAQMGPSVPLNVTRVQFAILGASSSGSTWVRATRECTQEPYQYAGTMLFEVSTGGGMESIYAAEGSVLWSNYQGQDTHRHQTKQPKSTMKTKLVIRETVNV